MQYACRIINIKSIGIFTLLCIYKCDRNYSMTLFVKALFSSYNYNVTKTVKITIKFVLYMNY